MCHVISLNSRIENTQTENVSPTRKDSEPKTDVVDSQYFAASPVNTESPPKAISGFPGYVKCA